MKATKKRLISLKPPKSEIKPRYVHRRSGTRQSHHFVNVNKKARPSNLIADVRNKVSRPPLFTREGILYDITHRAYSRCGYATFQNGRLVYSYVAIRH